METTWFVILASFCIIIYIKCILFLSKDHKKLPPGPSYLSSHLLLLTNSLPDLQTTIRKLKSKYGPLITLYIGSHPLIFVGSHTLAHKVLIGQHAATFADRPTTSSLYGISIASYGPTWRFLRRNLAYEYLHPACVKSYSSGRRWSLGILIRQLQEQQEAVGMINVVDHIEQAIFRLLVLMCFGEQLDEVHISEISSIQRGLLSFIGSFFNMYIVSPWLVKILFRKEWENFEQLREDQKNLFGRLIKSRVETIGDERNMAYADTLVNLKIPMNEDNGNGGRMTDEDIVNMCNEFLIAGTESSTTTLQWIMANLVKYPYIQSKLYDEIISVMGPAPSLPSLEIGVESVIDEDEIQKMPYLKAVVLEGLRRHPPGHFVLPHKVSEEVELQGYMIPKGATINFMVAEIGLDPKVWDDPMEFKPERFLSSDGRDRRIDHIRGNKGIKMMPFGAGRRICPGYNLALLHLQYFVANLIWYFHWTAPKNFDVDLSEKVDFFFFLNG